MIHLFSGKEHFAMSKKEMNNYIDKLILENENLKEENNNYKNDYLYTENLMLKDKVKDQDDLLFQLSQENVRLSNRVEDMEQQEEINERLEADKDLDYYSTKDLDKKEYLNVLDQITEQREIYKETINIMSDKYNISQDEIFDIIENDVSCKSREPSEIERV